MKKTLFALLVLSLTSCTTTQYYQLYKVNTEKGIFQNKKIVFEDTNCRVIYNLWKEGGDIGFTFFNKTGKDLTIDLTKTFFVINNLSYEYYQNRTFSNSASRSVAYVTDNYPSYYSSNLNSINYSANSSAITYNEKSELTIPARASVIVSEFVVSNSLYVHCDLKKYASKNKVNTLKFDQTNSPFVFYNIITYKTNTDTLRIENNFYVSEITNMPSSDMLIKEYKDNCGKKYDVPKHVFKNLTPDKFYIHYTLKYQ